MSEQDVSGKERRRLRNFLLDRRYQLRFTLTMVGMASLLTAGLGWRIINKAHEASRAGTKGALLIDSEMAHELDRQLQQQDQTTTLYLVLFGVAIAVLLCLYGIVLTHKVAGPLYKVSLYLDAIRDGKMGAVAPLRRGDQLVEFYAHFREAHEAIRKMVQTDIGLYARILPTLQEPSLRAAVEKAKAEKERSLELR